MMNTVMNDDTAADDDESRPKHVRAADGAAAAEVKTEGTADAGDAGDAGDTVDVVEAADADEAADTDDVTEQTKVDAATVELGWRQQQQWE
jgi:hypothetical protein